MRIWDILALVVMALVAILGKSWTSDDAESSPGRRPPIEIAKPPNGGTVPPITSRDPVISISVEDRQQSSTGTAFSVDHSGIWVTARHVADGCDKVALQKAERQFVRVRQILHHPHADISILRTNGGTPPLPGIERRVSRGQDGYSFGFPKGDPGDVHARVIGRRTMAIDGRYSTREPVVAWTQIRRVPDRGTDLGGISGGPWVNASGQIIGVHVAGAPRRGRSYSSTPESLLNILKQAGFSSTTVGNGSQKFAVNKSDFPTVGGNLRRRLTVAKVYCLVGQRWR
ncbi:MAG: trypsin-like peptidase domain-containing protein [Alphaproteobacteria bacterium]